MILFLKTGQAQLKLELELISTYCPYTAIFKLHLYFPRWMGGW